MHLHSACVRITLHCTALAVYTTENLRLGYISSQQCDKYADVSLTIVDCDNCCQQVHAVGSEECIARQSAADRRLNRHAAHEFFDLS